LRSIVVFFIVINDYCPDNGDSVAGAFDYSDVSGHYTDSNCNYTAATGDYFTGSGIYDTLIFHS
jgi:hypothetical protein